MKSMSSSLTSPAFSVPTAPPALLTSLQSALVFCGFRITAQPNSHIKALHPLALEHLYNAINSLPVIDVQTLNHDIDLLALRLGSLLGLLSYFLERTLPASKEDEVDAGLGEERGRCRADAAGSAGDDCCCQQEQGKLGISSPVLPSRLLLACPVQRTHRVVLKMPIVR